MFLCLLSHLIQLAERQQKQRRTWVFVGVFQNAITTKRESLLAGLVLVLLSLCFYIYKSIVKIFKKYFLYLRLN